MFKRVCVLAIILLAVTGCIGEKYNFKPPIVQLVGMSSEQKVEMQLTNLNWKGENNKKIVKKETDVFLIGKDLKKQRLNGEQIIEIKTDAQEEWIEKIKVERIKKDDIENLQKFGKKSFKMPEDEKDFLLLVTIESERGTAEYIANVQTKKKTQ